MLVLNRVVKDYRAHAVLVREIHKAAKRGAAKGYKLPKRLYAEFVDLAQGAGGVEGDAFYITVPYGYAKPKHRRWLSWFVGHELAHVWQAMQGHRGSLRHDAEFYSAFLAFCVRSAQPLEYRYRPQAAKRHGVPRRLP